MNVKTLSSGGFWLAVGGLSLGIAASAAADQPVDVLVQADSSTISMTQVAHGSPVHIVSTGRRVSYADINFNSATADAELLKRIGDAAKVVCQRLDSEFPGSKPSGAACETMTVKNALRQVHANESVAQRKASN